MDSTQKIKLLEDVLELDGGELSPEIELDTIESWDSVAKLSLIVMVEEEFGKILTGDIIKSFVRVEDIMVHMSE